MRKITRAQFDAYCYARRPMIRIIAGEVAWYEAFDRKLLAVITFDITDSDYGFVVLARDARKMFRCVNVDTSFATVKEAEKNLHRVIASYGNDGQEIYPQGDEKEHPYEIFIPVVVDDALHPYFRALISEERFEAARNLIREIVYSYKDPDGHYIKEFQTNGFDARLWELYLYVFLHNEGFEFIQGNPSPDFHLSKFGNEYLIEAVTVNPSQDPKRPDAATPTNDDEAMKLADNYLPIKFGSPLFSKMKKEYWNFTHVKGKPFILAIHDYHMTGSMTWSRVGLSEYLYGFRTRIHKDESGVDTQMIERIEQHEWNGKVIPSSFFSQPGTENVSAVLFSNAATITKFNRMGKLAGLGSQNVKMIRKGLMFDPSPNALRPKEFTFDVDSPEYEESWFDSIVMFHNSRALIPVDPAAFPNISHIWVDENTGECTGIQQPNDVLSSITVVLSTGGF
jgi:hypothetical protein